MAVETTTTFEPSFDIIQEEDCNTLLLYLPGFTKEQLKVQLTRTRDLRISGRRQLENNKISSFQKDFRVSEDCDANKITAKFEDGILYVRQPKHHPQPQTTAFRPPPAEPPKQQQPPPLPPKQQPTPLPKNQPPPLPKLQPPAPKKTGGEIKETTAMKSVDDQSEETKKPSKKTSEAEIRKEAGGAAAAKGVESGRRAAADEQKLNDGSPAARLKAAKQQVTRVVLMLFVFALGVYVAKLPWFSRTQQNP